MSLRRSVYYYKTEEGYSLTWKSATGKVHWIPLLCGDGDFPVSAVRCLAPLAWTARVESIMTPQIPGLPALYPEQVTSCPAGKRLLAAGLYLLDDLKHLVVGNINAVPFRDKTAENKRPSALPQSDHRHALHHPCSESVSSPVAGDQTQSSHCLAPLKIHRQTPVSEGTRVV